MILFTVDISNLLPAAPAQLGTFEVGALTALELLHVPRAAAVAFALLFHAQQVLPQIVIGLPLELHFLLVRRRSNDGAAPSQGRDPGEGTLWVRLRRSYEVMRKATGIFKDYVLELYYQVNRLSWWDRLRWMPLLLLVESGRSRWAVYLGAWIGGYAFWLLAIHWIWWR